MEGRVIKCPRSAKPQGSRSRHNRAGVLGAPALMGERRVGSMQSTEKHVSDGEKCWGLGGIKQGAVWEDFSRNVSFGPSQEGRGSCPRLPGHLDESQGLCGVM